jgi:hypothetical protein
LEFLVFPSLESKLEKMKMVVKMETEKKRETENRGIRKKRWRLDAEGHLE